MIENFDAKVLTVDGKEVPDAGLEDRPPLTVRMAVVHALFAPLPGEERLAEEEKFKRGMLASRIYDDANIALTAEEISLCKKCVGKAYPALIVLRAWCVLDKAVALSVVKKDEKRKAAEDK